MNAAATNEQPTVSLDGLEAQGLAQQTVATPLRIIEKVQAATAVRGGATGGRQN